MEFTILDYILNTIESIYYIISGGVRFMTFFRIVVPRPGEFELPVLRSRGNNSYGGSNSKGLNLKP